MNEYISDTRLAQLIANQEEIIKCIGIVREDDWILDYLKALKELQERRSKNEVQEVRE